MNVLILEDEQAAAKRLQQLVKEVAPDVVVLAVIETVKEAIAWLEDNPQPDLIISDIQLADGISFDVFAAAMVQAPIIFTTAYDAYLLKAFKVNSIDYLLKPIDKKELLAAFNKYRTLHKPADTNNQLAQLLQQLPVAATGYKSRFLIRQGEKLMIIPIEDVAYMRADDKVVFLHTTKNQKFIIDESLDELEKVLDPVRFFRINRRYIVPISSIDKIHNHFNGRLKIDLHYSDDNDIFVSRQRVAGFKKWLNR